MASVAHHAALVQKEFVLNFITSYMPLAFLLTPYLHIWGKLAQGLTFGQKELSVQEFQINPARITGQMFYCTVTAQIVNFATEAIVPYVKHKVMTQAKEQGILGKAAKVGANDAKEEAAFLRRVRRETELEIYDVTTDYREMVIQFGKFKMSDVAEPRIVSPGRHHHYYFT
jgi:hypothetical protein